MGSMVRECRAILNRPGIYPSNPARCYPFAMTTLSAAELISQGRVARREKRLADAKDCFARAVDFVRRAGDKALLAEALCGLGQIERDQGNTNAALEHYSEAVGLRRTGGDTLELAHTIRHVADILHQQGSPLKASPFYEKSLSIYRGNAA